MRPRQINARYHNEPVAAGGVAPSIPTLGILPANISASSGSGAVDFAASFLTKQGTETDTLGIEFVTLRIETTGPGIYQVSWDPGSVATDANGVVTIRSVVFTGVNTNCSEAEIEIDTNGAVSVSGTALGSDVITWSYTRPYASYIP